MLAPLRRLVLAWLAKVGEMWDVEWPGDDS
jgi:hypothetical protein